LDIDDSLITAVERNAVRRGRAVTELVETALRHVLASRGRPAKLPPLPCFRSGGAIVDVARRDALYRAMEDR
jgi:hypothetical protein